MVACFFSLVCFDSICFGYTDLTRHPITDSGVSTGDSEGGLGEEEEGSGRLRSYYCVWSSGLLKDQTTHTRTHIHTLTHLLVSLCQKSEVPLPLCVYKL